MANNPYVNKVQKADGTTIIDISDTTAAAADVAVGKYFYTAAGAKVEGTNSGSSLPDGDNMGYGTVGLVGTTWYFNEILDFTDFPEGQYDLAFVCNNTDYTELIHSILSPSDNLFYASLCAYTYPSPFPFMPSGWQNQAYRTISITGGTDATNSDLIAWIQANATEVTA